MSGFDFNVQDAILVFSIFIPVCLVWFSILLHPIKPAKFFYLCPMTAQERTQKVKRAYMGRVIFHMLIFMMGLILVSVVGRMTILSLVFLFISDLMFSALTTASTEETGGFYGMLFFLPLYLITCMVQMMIILGDDAHFVLQAVLYSVLFFMEVPIFIGYRKHIKTKMRQAVYFEEEA